MVLASLLAQLKTGAAAPRLAGPPKSRAIGLIAPLDILRCNSKAAFGRSRLASANGGGGTVVYPSVTETAGHGLQTSQFCDYLQCIATRLLAKEHKDFTLPTIEQ